MGRIKEKIDQYKGRIKQEYVYLSFYVLRIILAIIVMITFFQPRTNLTLLLFIITIIIGFIDYFRYRKTLLKSPTESVFNSLGDKLLIDLAAIALFVNNVLPLWALLLFLAKDAVFVFRDGYLFFKYKNTIFKQNLISRLTFYFQALLIIVTLFDSLDRILLWITGILTAINIIWALFSPEIKIVKKKTDYYQFAFKKLIKPADLFTLGNVFSGLLSIIFAITGSLKIASSLLILALVLDFFDGKVARWTKTENDFGKQLDSLADTVSFGVAPTVIGFTLTQTNLAIIAFSVFLLCGVLRLAKFNVMESQGVYIGMPITWNGLIIPIAIFASMPILYLPYLYLILAIAMVAPVQIKKKG